MKKIQLLVAVAIIVTTGMATAGAKSPPKAEGFRGSAAWGKLDLRLKQAWEEASEKGSGSRGLECLMKTTHPMSAEEKAMLKGAGFLHRSVIGRIVTGNITVADVPKVAGLEFIEAMELAVPLELK